MGLGSSSAPKGGPRPHPTSNSTRVHQGPAAASAGAKHARRLGNDDDGGGDGGPLSADEEERMDELRDAAAIGSPPPPPRDESVGDVPTGNVRPSWLADNPDLGAAVTKDGDLRLVGRRALSSGAAAGSISDKPGEGTIEVYHDGKCGRARARASTRQHACLGRAPRPYPPPPQVGHDLRPRLGPDLGLCGLPPARLDT